MDLTALNLFEQVVSSSVPYAVTWIVGTWVVNTVITWVTGRGYML